MTHPIERDLTRWPQVEGYCPPTSLTAGEPVPVRVASRARLFDVEVHRIGMQRELMWSATGLSAEDHDVPPRAWESGCGWPVAFEIPTQHDWRSGFYEIRFRDARGDDDPRSTSEAFFVLRPAPERPKARALMVLATTTYNAYNQWGGRCLYSGAWQVSFDRPLERGYLSRPVDADGFDGRITDVSADGDPTHRRLVSYQEQHHVPLLTDSAGWWNWERRFVRWAEADRFRFDMATSVDLDQDAGLLDDYSVMLSVGHDEYWSWRMRDAADRFVDRGGRWAILSGNTSFWQVRLEDSGAAMVCHKGAARSRDPVRGTDQEHLLTSMWSDPLIGRPETCSTGLTFTRGGYHRVGHAVADGRGGYEVHRPRHWAFDGTDLAPDELLGEGSFAVGYEVDGCELDWSSGHPTPTGADGAPADLEVLATAPARLISIAEDGCEAPPLLWASIDPPGDLQEVATVLFGDDRPEHVEQLAHGHAVMAHFTRGDGAVFNFGSADWCYGLDADPAVQRVTANVLRAFGLEREDTDREDTDRD